MSSSTVPQPEVFRQHERTIRCSSGRQHTDTGHQQHLAQYFLPIDHRTFQQLSSERPVSAPAVETSSRGVLHEPSVITVVSAE
eukprot:3325728-Alexandrium_andersonii.AAC.1